MPLEYSADGSATVLLLTTEMILRAVINVNRVLSFDSVYVDLKSLPHVSH